jgi:hypothetical protein
MIEFGTLHPDGTLTDRRWIPQEDVLACPAFILASAHYREDGRCRCDDPTHDEMGEWGYRWNAEAGRWQ